jgi:hypothetical protein
VCVASFTLLIGWLSQCRLPGLWLQCNNRQSRADCVQCFPALPRCLQALIPTCLMRPPQPRATRSAPSRPPSAASPRPAPG